VQHLPLREAAKLCDLGTTQVRPAREQRPRPRPGASGASGLPPRADYARSHLSLQFKLQCRQLGITRWPYRKLQALKTTIETCRAAAADDAAGRGHAAALPRGSARLPAAAASPGAADGATAAPASDPAGWVERLEALEARERPSFTGRDDTRFVAFASR